MAQKIARFDAAFTEIGVPVTMEIPTGSTEVALRVYRDQNPNELSIYVLVDIPPAGDPPPPNYHRTFELIGENDSLPDTFKKYIGTIPFGPDKEQAHIIEVA